MAYRLPGATASETYYHALYHHVAHWAAYVGTMVALLTITVVLSGSPGPLSGARLFGFVIADLAATGAAIYFIRGMGIYGGIIRTALSPDYLGSIERFPHRVTVWLGHSATLVLSIVNLVLIRFLS
jgi:hypothetical protein